MSSNQNFVRILREHGLAPKKKLGQNFLVHRQTAARIVDLAGVGPDDFILELGVGFGTLTKPIAERAANVIGLEIDAGIVKWHKEEGELPDNVTLIHEDLLKSDFRELAEKCGGCLKILANLPYSVSNPLFFKLIECRDVVKWAVLMVQKEVGQRLCAEPGTKKYGILSVLLGSCASVQTLMKLGPGQFHPRPKVDSVVIRILFDPPPERARLLPPYDRKIFHRLVKSAFQKRRKTLINSLSSSGFPELDKDTILQVLEKCGIPSGIRAERLTIEDFVKMTIAFQPLNH
ncbi:MAG: ribosomal RNA small subunit methyltransferase A [Desulfobulbaceae bacterium]|nr:ribosomal RNA small subunit methyltransferase A [Desulfobulbaceae bacterium]